MKFSHRNVDGMENTVVVELKGKLTGGPEAEEFRDLFKTLTSEGKIQVVINLKNVDWIASTGIGILIRGYKTVREANGDVILVHVGERTQQVFNVLRLEHIFRIMETEEDAFKAFKS